MVGSARSEAASPLLCKTIPVGPDSETKFDEPWEARAFAIIVRLAQDGHFEWSEWVECFSGEVAADTAIEAAGGVPRSYYEQWLDAAEKLMIAKGVTNEAQLRARRFAAGSVGPTNVMK
ncbi:nitrile hydratase accessory protein [Rhodopseudomonas sp. AAP120]|uniref:nitrile hydratase accessory protein n=1 Tax=Rhodopseudomonas sp. AAP120 TaxID=1523430 RepID=UPI0006B9116F|nr:nitrile hydratase accessory protein [Rhodopseudomonas sp. AAP120]